MGNNKLRAFVQKAALLLFAVILLTSYKQKEQTWVAIGDSITYLNDHLNETGNRLTKGYLSRLTEEMPGLHYINKGYNGWTAGNIAQRIDQLGLTYADVYSVFLGTNDWWQGRPLGMLEDYKTNKGNASVYGSFRIIIDRLRLLNPQAKILLITPLQRSDFVYINDQKNNAFGSYQANKGQTLESFVNAIDSIAIFEHIPVVDLYHNKQLDIKDMVNFKRLKDPQTGAYRNYKYPEFIRIPFNPATDNYPYPPDAIGLSYDGLHPSDKGNAIIAGAIVREFKKMGL